ncbi:SRPBCC family protein [Pedobacter deserti]|uniref:SRPBCC family protein n=1 Tax=Pedobacter deserti TaxID=2817382 RepID=UPI002108B0C0|nr:SRPBCC family protein [Pedobacter sp. SYSU D00382]
MEQNQNFVEAQMLIRKPASEVFNAFCDPEQTKHFWFTKGSGRLEKGATVTWTWEMYDVSAEVIVRDIVADKLIQIEWGDPATTVEFNFQEMGEDKTYVIIRNYGFPQQGDDLLREIKDSTGGFTTVLDGLKAYLEHGINLNLIADKYPG